MKGDYARELHQKCRLNTRALERQVASDDFIIITEFIADRLDHQCPTKRGFTGHIKSSLSLAYCRSAWTVFIQTGYENHLQKNRATVYQGNPNT